MQNAWNVTADGVRLAVRLTPKADRDAIGGIIAGDGGHMLKVRVRAAPEDGKANDALLRLLAEALALPRRCFDLAQGASSRRKLVDIAGDPPAILSALEHLKVPRS